MCRVIGMLLGPVGLREGVLVIRSLGLGWSLSNVGTSFVALLFQSSPPYNSGMPSWSRYHNTTLHRTSFCMLFCLRTIINISILCNYQNIINYHVLLVKNTAFGFVHKLSLRFLNLPCADFKIAPMILPFVLPPFLNF